MQVYKSSPPKNHSPVLTRTNTEHLFDNEPALNDILILINQACGIQCCGISLLDKDANWQTIAKGFETAMIPEDNLFFKFIRDYEYDLTIEDAYKVSRFNNDILVRGDFKIRFFKSLSLVDEASNQIGFLFLMDQQAIHLQNAPLTCLHILLKQLQAILLQTSASLTYENPTFPGITYNKPAGKDRDVKTLRENLKSLEDYKYALDESSIVAITDENGIITYVNDNFCRISKYSREELVGNDHRVVNSGYHSKEFFKDLWDTIKKGKIWRGELKNMAKDGSTYWVFTVIVPFVDEYGLPYQYIAIRTNVTQNKLSEDKISTLNEALIKKGKKYRALIENNNDIITLLDKNFVSLYRSPSAARITGWDDDKSEGGNKLERIHPDDFDLVLQVFKKAIKEPGKTFDINFRTLHRQGHYIWLEGTITNLLHDPSLGGLVLNLRDVTERKKADALLNDKNKQISDILEHINDGFIALDKDFNYTYVNSHIGEMTGRKPESLIGKNVWEEFPETINSKTHEAFHLAMSTQQYVQNVDYYPELNLWHENHIYPSADGIIVFVKDITNQKRAEKELKHIHDRLAFHLINSPLALIEWDKDFIVTNWSPQATKFFGWTEAETIGRHFAEFNLVYDEDKYYSLPMIDKLMTGEIESSKNYNRNNTKSGEVIYCEWYNSVLKNEKGDVVSIMSLVQDVTERKKAEEGLRESEEKYRVLIEEAVDGIIVFSPVQQRFINVNKKMVELLGYSREALLQMHYSQLIFDEIVIDNKLAEKLRNNTDGITIERVLHRIDESLLDVEVNIKLMPGGNYLCFIRDITERKKAAQEILLLNEGLEHKVAERTVQLETANKDLEAFCYSVSHDLRTPLRAIHGYANILQEDFAASLDKEGIRLLNEVQLNAKKMSSLIDDLLTFSRMGRKPIVTTQVNMSGLCITAFDEVNITRQKKVELIIHELSDAMADYTLIKQVMINLISNAIKYSSKTEFPKIEISCINREDDLVFSVADNGVGFEMKYVHKLFNVFQRLHSADEFEGTGVGLATVYRIITKHGGKVWAEARLNEGATFYFSLPREANPN